MRKTHLYQGICFTMDRTLVSAWCGRTVCEDDDGAAAQITETFADVACKLCIRAQQSWWSEYKKQASGLGPTIR